VVLPLTRAITLDELAACWPQPRGHLNAEVRLKRWREVSAKGDSGRFLTRLGWDGLTSEAATAMLGAGTGDRPPPSAGTELLDGIATGHRTLADTAEELAAVVSRRLELRLPRTVRVEIEAELRNQLDAIAVRSEAALEPVDDHPALARLLAEVAYGRLTSVVEVLERLAADRTILWDRFGLPKEVPLTRLTTALSDPHDAGHTVMALDFSSGRRLIYKPRNCGPEAWLSRTFSALSDLRLRGPVVVDLTSHGWAEFISPRIGSHDVHRRGGALLALAHVLGATDLHDENVIVSGPQPVIVDAETILQPELAQGDGSGSTIFDTELIDMARGSPPAAAQEVAAGFLEACETLRRYGEALDALLTDFRAPLRYVVRPTRLYSMVMDKSLRPRRPGWSVDRSIELDALARSALAEQRRDLTSLEPPPAWYIVRAERLALERGDVPRFTVEPRGHDLRCGTATVVRDLFRRSPVERARQRLAALEPSGARLDAEMIRRALETTPAESTPKRIPRKRTNWLTLAEDVGRALEGQTIRGEDGTAWWLGIQPAGPTRWEPRVLGVDLYAGTAGVGLYASWLAHVAGDAAWSALARAAVLHGRRRMSDWLTLGAGDRPTRVHGLAGLGSVAYAWTRIGELLGDPILTAEGRAASMLAAESGVLVKADLVSGVSGSLIAALAAGSVVEAQTIARCQVPADAPATMLCSAELGLAHGPGGLALALARLADTTAAPNVREAAQSALRHARAAPRNGNWCRGSAGLLAASLMLMDTSKEHDAALRLADDVATNRSSRLDFCCGLAGQIDVLLLAAERLGQPRLQRAATDAAMAARPAIERLVTVDSGAARDPSLFVGLAGIGYALLRLARPSDVPALAVLA
jgi:lantibiotic modifying enzyme